MAIHGRTRSQAYSGLADWDYIRRVKDSAKLPILGNGDLTSAAKANHFMKQSGVDGVMIGRGCLKNPWIFRESQNLRLRDQSTVERDFFNIFEKLKGYLEAHCDERITLLQLKKLSCWYSTGYPGAANYRRKVFQIKEKDALVDWIYEYFETIASSIQEDTSMSPF